MVKLNFFKIEIDIKNIKIIIYISNVSLYSEDKFIEFSPLSIISGLPSRSSSLRSE